MSISSISIHSEGNLVFENNSIQISEDAKAVGEIMLERLRTYKGEIDSNQDDGIVVQELLQSNYQSLYFQILNTEDVIGIEEATIQENKKSDGAKVLNLNLVIKTNYGTKKITI